MMRITHVMAHFPFEECHIERLEKVLSALGEPLIKEPFFRGKNVRLYASKRGIFWFAGIEDNMNTDWVPFWTERFTHNFMNLLILFIEVEGDILNNMANSFPEGVSVHGGIISSRRRKFFVSGENKLPFEFVSVRIPHSGIEVAFYSKSGEIPVDGNAIREVELRLLPEVVSLYGDVFKSLSVPLKRFDEILEVDLGEQTVLLAGKEPYHRAIVRFRPDEKRFAGRGLNILSLRMETSSV